MYSGNWDDLHVLLEMIILLSSCWTLLNAECFILQDYYCILKMNYFNITRSCCWMYYILVLGHCN